MGLGWGQTRDPLVKKFNHLRNEFDFRKVHVHARIQEFSSGGGVSRSVWQKKLWQRFCFCFFSPQLILQKSWMVNFKEIYHFSRFQRGSNIFQGGGGPTVSRGGGSNSLFPIETHITCDFPGRVRTPCPLLWIRIWWNHEYVGSYLLQSNIVLKLVLIFSQILTCISTRLLPFKLKTFSSLWCIRWYLFFKV